MDDETIETKPKQGQILGNLSRLRKGRGSDKVGLPCIWALVQKATYRSTYRIKELRAREWKEFKFSLSSWKKCVGEAKSKGELLST